MITAEQAIEIARVRASSNGWRFADPVRCELRRGWFGSVDRYEIETNAGQRGTKAWFKVEAGEGQIVGEGYIPR